MYQPFKTILKKEKPKMNPLMIFGMLLVMAAFAFRVAGWETILYVFLFAGLGVGLYGIYLNNQARTKAWEQLATQLGVTIEKHPINGPSIKGNYRGHELNIFEGRKSNVTGQSGTNYTYIGVSNPALAPQAQLYVKTTRGQRNFENRAVGELFAEIFEVTGAPNEKLAQALSDPRFQSGLLDLALQRSSLTVTFQDHGVKIEEAASLTDIAYLQSLIDFLVDLQAAQA